MPDQIQRAPSGLLDVLNLQGGRTPQLLLDEVRATIDTLQFYANTAPVVQVVQNAALTSGNQITVGVPQFPRQWWLVRGVSAQVQKTATMTRCRISCFVRSVCVAVEDLSFSTATVGLVSMAPWTAPYPMILQQGDSVVVALELLGTDANADVRARVAYGMIG